MYINFLLHFLYMKSLLLNLTTSTSFCKLILLSCIFLFSFITKLILPLPNNEECYIVKREGTLTLTVVASYNTAWHALYVGKRPRGRVITINQLIKSQIRGTKHIVVIMQ